MIYEAQIRNGPSKTACSQQRIGSESAIDAAADAENVDESVARRREVGMRLAKSKVTVTHLHLVCSRHD